MLSFKELFEQKKSGIEIYHGDNFKTTKIEPKLMNNGNVQEGVGIYFGTLEVAESYGKNIVKVTINPKKFIDSRAPIGKALKGMFWQLLKKLHKINPEPLWYDLTDWGYEIEKPEDVTSENLRRLALDQTDEEVRNIQFDLARSFGVETFVKVWNKQFPEIHGTYGKSTGFYAIINPNIKLEEV